LFSKNGRAVKGSRRAEVKAEGPGCGAEELAIGLRSYTRPAVCAKVEPSG
jgi:hypothetical protein